MVCGWYPHRLVLKYNELMMMMAACGACYDVATSYVCLAFKCKAVCKYSSPRRILLILCRSSDLSSLNCHECSSTQLTFLPEIPHEFIFFSMLHNNPALMSASHSKIDQQLRQAEKKLSEVKAKIASAAAIPEQSTYKANEEWTKAYKKWGQWDDIEELKELEKTEQQKYEAILSKMDPMGHSHDHSKEKDFFEQSEEDKIKRCEYHRLMGNYLYQEGMIPKAAESYKIAIAYYEYCFPDDADIQQELDSLRHACLCNIALCYVRMGHFREAIGSVDFVVRETDGKHSKAYFRRAQAYRCLDEYENASEDLKKALQLTPGDQRIVQEMADLKALAELYGKNSKDMAKRMISSSQQPRDDEEQYETGASIKSGGGDPQWQQQPEEESVRNREHISRAAEDVFNFFLPLEPVISPAICRLGDAMHDITTTIIASSSSSSSN